MGGTPPKLAVGSLPSFLCSSAVEPSTVNRLVAGSNPAGGVHMSGINNTEEIPAAAIIMSLTRLDNLYSSKTGKYLYVSPDDFNATDELDNRGNSPLRPFKTIQRAFLEVARFSYQPGANNDRFDQFSIMLMPGDHYIDNRPGLVNYSIGGTNLSRNRYFDAGNLIEANKNFIAYEAYARMIANPINAGFVPPTGDPQDCIDDVLDALDAVIYNVKFGGNDRVFDAALFYQNEPALIDDEQDESIEVYANALVLAKQIITNSPVGGLEHPNYLTELNIGEAFVQFLDPTISVGPPIYGETGSDVPYGQSDTCADVQSALDVLFGIIEDGINGALDLNDRNEPESLGELPVFGFDINSGEWNDNSIIDLSNPDNIYWKFNASTGGCIVPRGCSLVGYDLRRTIVRPLYVPDPADSNQERTSIFNLTGGCYLWQFTIKDGDLSNNSPLFDVNDNVGKVYYQKGNISTFAVPDYSHHKITIMEYAERKDLDAFYEKVGVAFSQYQPTIDEEGEFDALVQENRIVGPLSDTRSIESIRVVDTNLGQPNQKLVLTVTTKVDHGYFKDQFVAILNTGLDEETNGTFKIASINPNNPRIFTYEIPGKVSAGLGLINNNTYQVGTGLSNNAIAQAEIDSVESASPYVFNCSIRSTWGMCGMWANGAKATGFKSMVVAQYTGVSLQKDDRAFIRYDEFTNTWNQASLTDAFASVPYHTKGDAYWKDDWRNFHIRASEDSFIQCVSVFAVGFFDHFLMESGGDMSITNSNSNFGNTSLHSIGHKGFSFNQDKGGFITDIIPPQELSGGYSSNPNIPSTNSERVAYYPVDIVTSNDLGNATKLFLGSEAVYDPAQRPAATLNGYRIGARPDEKLFVKLEELTDGSGQNFSATLTPTGVNTFQVGIDFLNPTGIGIDNYAQDAANLVNNNKEFIQDETYGYITTKYPDLLTNGNITIETCRRDIGYYVDAIVQDLRLGGNINSVQAAEAYFVGGQLTYIQGEKDETIDALGVTRDLCIAAMRNFDYLLTGCSSTSGSDVITVPSTQGIVVGMKVESYTTINPANNTEPSGSPSATIPIDSYVIEIVDDTTIRIGEKGQYKFGTEEFDPSPTDKLATQTITASGPGTGLFLWFTMRDELVPTAQDNIVAVRDGIFSLERTVYDDTITQDFANITAGETECGNVASIIAGLFLDIITILSSDFGEDGVDRIEPTTDFSALSKRATTFRIAGGNPHEMETGTAVRLIPKAAPGTNPDPRVIRLPKGFETNTKYYVIAPGRRTSPEDYSATTAFDGSDQTVFMLASTLENARAGNYIYSPETDAIDPEVVIEINQYIIDGSYDLYQYEAQVAVGAGSGVIQTDLAHSFDKPASGVEPQKVFFRQIDVDTPLPNRTVVQGQNSFQLPVDPQDEYFVRYQTNNLFSIHQTEADALNDVNRIILTGNLKFLVFANKRFSPLKFDPKPISYGVTTSFTGQWYLQVKDETADPTNILGRITVPEDVSYSGTAPSATRSGDTFFERVIDDRIKEDRVYKLRYVVPRYLETVRDPLNGFVIKTRTDDKRRLKPQKLILKPVDINLHSDSDDYTSTSIATFLNDGGFDQTGQFVNTNEKLGRTSQTYSNQGVTAVYDPYINPKIIETSLGKTAFSVQSAKVISQPRLEGGQTVDYKYLELTAFDHTILNQAIKNERFTVVEIDAPDGIGFTANATVNNNTNLIQWSGASSGTGYLHAYLTTSNPVSSPKSVNAQRYYLIIKTIVDGEINYNKLSPTSFFQGGSTLSTSLVSAQLLAKPDSIGDPDGLSKSSRDDYLYAVQGANIYTLAPGDVITDDAGNDYYIDEVNDAGEIEDTFYIFDIEEVKERIPGQQDGIYYLICLKGDIRPFPTGPGVGENFRNFKFSQPISYLYPQDYKNDPFWFEQIDPTLNDPPATSSAADNYTHGLVTVNDARYSETKEVVNFLIETPALDEYEYVNDIVGSVDARIRAQSGNAESGAEDRKIPIKGTNQFPTDERLYVELRRPSIARSGNHTFEYLGFGPGNYSTGFPLRQEVILTDAQDFYAQSKREDGGIVFYTGLNSNGDLYIGNKKVNAITGEETFLESAQLIGSEDEDDDVGSSLVTTFESPVTFNDKITVNGVASFTQPVTIAVDADDAIAPISALRIQSLVDSINLGEDPTLSRSNFLNRAEGDIVLSKNQISSAIFKFNGRGNTAFTGQVYSLRTHYMTEQDEFGDFTLNRPSNLTPEQSGLIYDAGNALSAASNRLFPNQNVTYGNSSAVPTPGDILLKGKEVGRSGSWGWIYANTFDTIPNALIGIVATPKFNTVTQQYVIGAGVGDPDIEASNLVRFQWAISGGQQLTNQDIFDTYGLSSESLVRVFGVTGDLSSIVNGTFNVFTDTYNINSTFIDIVVNTNIASVDLVEDWNDYQPDAVVEASSSVWKELGVLGAEAIRTETNTIGKYKVGINTVARSAHSDYYTQFVNSTTTDPRANLDVFGTTFISGRTLQEYRDPTYAEDALNRPLDDQDNAVLVGGNAYSPDDEATLRVSTTNGGRVGVNTTNDQLNGAADGQVFNKDFAVQGSAAISGNLRVEQDLEVNGAPSEVWDGSYVEADLTSLAPIFNFVNTSTTTEFNAGGYLDTIRLFDITTGSQTINVGTNAANDISQGETTLFNLHTTSTNSTINLGTVPEGTGSNVSEVTIGGAIGSPNTSFLRVQNFRTIFDGKLVIRGGASQTNNTGIIEAEGIESFEFLPDGVRTLNIGTRVGTLNIAGTTGTTTVRNSLEVLGSALVKSDITLEGGLRNTSLGIERNVFGNLFAVSLTSDGSTVTLTLDRTSNLSVGDTIEVYLSNEDYAPAGTVTVTGTPTADTIQYPASGPATSSPITVTGVVVRVGVGSSQSVGDLEANNLNVDYYQLINNIAPTRTVNTVTAGPNYKLLFDFNYFVEGNPVIFTDIGNLTNVVVDTIYFVIDSEGSSVSNTSGSSGIIISETPNGPALPIGLVGGATDAGNARIVLAQTQIDTSGGDAWGGSAFLQQPAGFNGQDVYRLFLNNPQGVGANQYLLVNKEVLFTINEPSFDAPYFVDVVRAQDGTALVEHPDGDRIFGLGKEVAATYIFPSPLNATDTNLNVGEFTAVVEPGDLFRLNPAGASSEWVRITNINLSDAQSLVVNNGDFGSELNPLEPYDVFKVVSTNGNTRIIGDLTIGYDTSIASLLDDDVENSQEISARTSRSSSTAFAGGGLDETGGGTLRVHNSIELSGNATTSLPERQYMVITNGEFPRFFFETASGDMSLYGGQSGGANFTIYSDEFFSGGPWSKTRTDSASNVKFNVAGQTGNTIVAGTLRGGDDLNIGTLVDRTQPESPTNFYTSRFSVAADTGVTIAGESLTITGQISATPLPTTPIFDVQGLGVDGLRSFTINQDASINAFGQEAFYNLNGGRKTIFVSEQGNTDQTARQLVSNLQYAVRPSSTLILKLPDTNVQTGDTVRIVDVGGALNSAISLVIRAGTTDPIQGQLGGTTLGGLASTYQGGELIVNTPNAAFGLIYLGASDAEGSSIPGAQQGWFLMEI